MVEHLGDVLPNMVPELAPPEVARAASEPAIEARDMAARGVDRVVFVQVARPLRAADVDAAAAQHEDDRPEV